MEGGLGRTWSQRPKQVRRRCGAPPRRLLRWPWPAVISVACRCVPSYRRSSARCDSDGDRASVRERSSGSRSSRSQSANSKRGATNNARGVSGARLRLVPIAAEGPPGRGAGDLRIVGASLTTRGLSRPRG
ncbi:hypothetical protein DAEQUDRAFT_84437 [Daedalea quercina L-15889]|uniref:Uncharacterized protein n=1 Tax=Daedalea quercina L-15889 TaxID=1314783 RepID=A0A165L3F3_9APHY|nr:hypothetical protein DAEQUDRAFT_84437 [Daedalea quercina L-15889]